MINTHELVMSIAHNESKSELVTALCDIALRSDDDFTGSNGDEYLWDSAEQGGFETNMDYVLSLIKDNMSTYEIIYTFFEHWVGIDNYYDSYDYDFTIMPSGEVVIALSYVHES